MVPPRFELGLQESESCMITNYIMEPHFSRTGLEPVTKGVPLRDNFLYNPLRYHCAIERFPGNFLKPTLRLRRPLAPMLIQPNIASTIYKKSSLSIFLTQLGPCQRPQLASQYTPGPLLLSFRKLSCTSLHY